MTTEQRILIIVQWETYREEIRTDNPAVTFNMIMSGPEKPLSVIINNQIVYTRPTK